MKKNRIQDEFTYLAINNNLKYKLRKKRDGKCVLCGKTAVSSDHCLKHAIAKRERSRKKLGHSKNNNCRTRKLEMEEQAIKFIRESNKIEGILRQPSRTEIEEYIRFMGLTIVGVQDLEIFVNVYQPGARMRDVVGLDVRVGGYYPPAGGILIRKWLQTILWDIVEPKGGLAKLSAYKAHQKYGALHPFTDGNGRSGRMLWRWQVGLEGIVNERGFLHTWYYQSLDEGSRR